MGWYKTVQTLKCSVTNSGLYWDLSEGLSEQKTGHAQGFVLPPPENYKTCNFPIQFRVQWVEWKTGRCIRLKQSTSSAWVYWHTTRGTVTELRTAISFRIQLSEMDPTPVQVSQRLHPLNPWTRVPQFEDRLTTCVEELWGKQEKVLGVLDVKWKIKSGRLHYGQGSFSPKQRGRGRWSGRNRQKKRIHTTVPLLHLPLLLTADYRKTGVYIKGTWHSNSSHCLAFFSFNLYLYVRLTVAWRVKPCSLVGTYRRFIQICYLLLAQKRCFWQILCYTLSYHIR